MERLDRLLERLDYTVVQGNTQIEITEVIYDSRKVLRQCSYRKRLRCRHRRQ